MYLLSIMAICFGRKVNQYVQSLTGREGKGTAYVPCLWIQFPFTQDLLASWKP